MKIFFKKRKHEYNMWYGIGTQVHMHVVRIPGITVGQISVL